VEKNYKNNVGSGYKPQRSPKRKKKRVDKKMAKVEENENSVYEKIISNKNNSKKQKKTKNED